jgi:hypothetical protein
VNSQNSSSVSLPFANLDWVSDDSTISFGYQSDRFGGKYSFKKSNITSFGAVQGWVQFGGPDAHLKISAGNDNDSTYADPLGADPGPRVYTGGTGNNWQAHKNPDNITQGNGVVLNGVWRGLTVDLAASQFTVTPRKTQTPKPGTVNTYGDTEDMDLQYGGRVGYQLGGFGKLNLSYILAYTRLASKFGWDTQTLTLTATAADAEVYTHHYAAFAGLTPVSGLGVTLGYSGIVTKYLDEYWTINGIMTATFPLIWKHAVNLNLRYTGLLAGALRLRTDNSMTVYTDKNYSTLDLSGASWGQDYNAAASGKNYAEIQHFFLWNGLGAEYDLAQFGGGRKVMLTLYARNLLRQELANSRVEVQEYRYIRVVFA